MNPKKPRRTPMEIAYAWYQPDEIWRSIQSAPLTRVPGELHIPKDTTSREFSDWLTDQYRLAMMKGIQLGRDGSEDTSPPPAPQPASESPSVFDGDENVYVDSEWLKSTGWVFDYDSGQYAFPIGPNELRYHIGGAISVVRPAKVVHVAPMVDAKTRGEVRRIVRERQLEHHFPLEPTVEPLKSLDGQPAGYILARHRYSNFPVPLYWSGSELRSNTSHDSLRQEITDWTDFKRLYESDQYDEVADRLMRVHDTLRDVLVDRPDKAAVIINVEEAATELCEQLRDLTQQLETVTGERDRLQDEAKRYGQQLATVTADVKHWIQQWDDLHNEVNRYAEKLATAEAELDRLREALRPFTDTSFLDDDYPDDRDCGFGCKAGDLRRAAELVPPEQRPCPSCDSHTWDVSRLTARIRDLEACVNEWLDKTNWVQEKTDWTFSVLGKHRADVMREEIERLKKIVVAWYGTDDPQKWSDEYRKKDPKYDEFLKQRGK